MTVTLDPAFIEREYNNRALVPDHPAFFARWEKDSAFVRSTLPCTLDLAYGPASGFRILTSTDRGASFNEQALIAGTEYLDVSGDPPAGGVIFYRIVATNAAGGAQ